MMMMMMMMVPMLRLCLPAQVAEQMYG